MIQFFINTSTKPASIMRVIMYVKAQGGGILSETWRGLALGEITSHWTPLTTQTDADLFTSYEEISG